MAVYQVDIEKSFNPTTSTTVYWTNVYYVNAADVASATTSGQSIVTLEKTIHGTTVAFTKMRIRLAALQVSPGTIIALSGNGGRTANNPLPLFDVVRVDFSVATGRPNRKYLRLPLGSADNSAGALVAGTVTTVQNSYMTPLINMNVVCDTQGQPILSGSVWPYVAMRQLRRGSKKKTTPVI